MEGSEMAGMSWVTAMSLWGRYDPDEILDELTAAVWNHARTEGIGRYYEVE